MGITESDSDYLMNISQAGAVGANPLIVGENQQTRTPGQELGASEFLKLLVVQLTSQDPLSPMEDTAFIEQMSSFTSLEQMRMLTSDFAKFRQEQENLAAYNFLGKHISLHDEDGNAISGVVDSIVLEGGKPRIVVGGEAYDPATVFKVEQASVTAPDTGDNKNE